MADRPSYASDVDAIVTAAYEGDFELVKSLVDEGAELDITDDFGSTAVIVASEQGYDAIVEFLLGRGANINAMDSDGDTALDIARYHGRISTVEILIAYGAVGREGPSAKERSMDLYYEDCEKANEIKYGRKKP